MARSTHFLRKEPISSAAIILLFALGIALLPVADIGAWFGLDGTRAVLVGMLLTRAVGAGVLAALLVGTGYRLWRGTGWISFLACLPFLLVAVNNGPWIALGTGAVAIEATAWDYVLYAAECFAVASFEEIAFRGLILPLFVERAKDRESLLGMLIAASAVFGLAHLVNLIGGAGVGATFLQVGYSFLIGLMCGLTLYVTRCLPLCVVLHAVYNFGGLLVDTFGTGNMWTHAAIAVTAVLGVAAAVYGLALYARMPAAAIFGLLGRTQENSEEEKSEQADGSPSEGNRT